jgi:hypothetical protein
MRPKLAMWSDYGVPAQKHWTRASKQTAGFPKSCVSLAMVASAPRGPQVEKLRQAHRASCGGDIVRVA